MIAPEISLKILKFAMGQFQDENICLLGLSFIYVSLVTGSPTRIERIWF